MAPEKLAVSLSCRLVRQWQTLNRPIASPSTVHINTRGPLPPAWCASFLSARVPPGPMSSLRSHLDSVTWPRGIPQEILPPPLIQWVIVPWAPLSLPFDLDKALSDGHWVSTPTDFIFWDGKGGNSSAKAEPPLLHLHNTRGRVAFSHFVITNLHPPH